MSAGTTSATAALRVQVGHELELIRADPVPLVAILAAPLLLVAFSAPAYEHLGVVRAGDAAGVNFILPGQTAMFGLLLVAIGGFSFYREHGWGTWDRLRTSNAPMWATVAGKLVPWWMVAAVQGLLTAAAGRLLFGYHVGSPLAYTLLTAALALVIVSLMFAAYAWLPTVYHLNAAGNLGGIVLGGLGGAFAPVDAMPDWVRSAARVTPSYWAIDGLREVVLRDAGVADVGGNLLALGLIAALVLLVGAVGFRASAPKRSWAN